MIRILLTATLTLSALPALAFDRSDARLLEGGWPPLETEYTAGREAQVFAIVEGDNVLYAITYNVQGALQPLGLFACSDAFEVQQGVTSGWHDILCVHQGGHNRVLRFDPSFGYR